MIRYRFKSILSSFPLFVLLLPLFFVAHGYIENYNFVPLDEAALLVLFYVTVSALIFFLCWLFYRSSAKAAVFTATVLFFQFFFGSLLDQLRKWFPESFISQYSFLLPVIFIILVSLFIILKRRKKTLYRLTTYLNVLLIIVIVADLAFFIPTYLSFRRQNRQQVSGDNFSACDTCSRPDIYLIVADEYAGNTELRHLLNFDNSGFLDSLKQKGFRVMEQSHSNYISTVSSMASFFEMNYLHTLQGSMEEESDDEGFNVFRNNLSLRFLKKQGYTIVNHSPFDVDGIKGVQLDFLPRQTALITFHTLTNRVWHDLGFNFATRFKIKKLRDKYLYKTLKTTRKSIENTRSEITRDAANPRFIYTHLMMPHFPFYYHKDGSPFPAESLREELQVVRENYVEYLQYANKQYLSLIAEILAQSKKSTVILFLSDHGYRHFADTAAIDERYKYINLSCIYLPGGRYAAFPDNLGNVNYLRTFFNVQFRQKFPIVADSIYIIADDKQTGGSYLKAQKWEGISK